MSNFNNIIDRHDACQKACLDALDKCSMVTGYMTVGVCYQNYSACADSCGHVKQPEGDFADG
jgi:hypothetical protein